MLPAALLSGFLKVLDPSGSKVMLSPNYGYWAPTGVNPDLGLIVVDSVLCSTLAGRIGVVRDLFREHFSSLEGSRALQQVPPEHRQSLSAV